MGAEGVLLRTVETGARFASTVVATCASKRRKLGSSIDSRSSHRFVYMPTQFCCLCALVELGQIFFFFQPRVELRTLSYPILFWTLHRVSESVFGSWHHRATVFHGLLLHSGSSEKLMMWKARFRIRRSWQWYIHLVELGPDVKIQVLSCSYMLFY